MSVFAGGGLPGGKHGDVLGASPEDAVSKENLVEELKRRAKGEITSKNYPDAVALYSKAITIYPDNSILYANRSMCNLSMKKKQEALDDACKSIELDSSYAKGFYRKCMAHIALDQYKSAHDALTGGLALVPDDKVMKTQLEKIVIELDKRAASGSSLDGSNSTGTGAGSKTTSTSASSSSSKPAVKPKPAPTKAKVESKDDDDDEEEEDLGGHVRGYKLTSDGRKTSFFNNEMDEHTKALIGDIAPKPITPGAAVDSSAPTLLASAPAAAEGTSAWNTAGTFESRDHSSWAQEAVKKHLATVSVSLPSGEGTVAVTKVSSVTGDAEIASARGKTKHIYDLSADINWEISMNDSFQAGASLKKCKGSLTIADITGDLEYEFLVDMGKDNWSGSLALAQKHVKSSCGVFQGALTSALKEMHAEFKKKV